MAPATASRSWRKCLACFLEPEDPDQVARRRGFRQVEDLVPLEEEGIGGEELCGGFFLVPWSLKGDLDYFAKGLHLRRYQAKDLVKVWPKPKSILAPLDHVAYRMT